jgi:transposase
LLYLPAYSPNLNLIERLWKFVKKQCLYSKYYTPGSRGSGRVRGFFEQAGLKPMSSRRHAL